MVENAPYRTLRVVVVEDQPDDAELMMQELGRSGVDTRWTRVETEASLVEALRDGADLVLTDYAVPRFGARAAIGVVRAHAPDVPVVVVSGAIGEEAAIDCLRDGADDCLRKDRLGRLPSAVSRALDQRALVRGAQLAVEEHRLAQDRLHRVQKLESLARLAGGIAHQFNNLFAGILGYTELLLEDLGADDPRRDDVMAIQDSIEHATGLTRRLLAFSARNPIKPARMAINDVVESVVVSLRQDRPAPAIELDLAPALDLVAVDRAQLEQVVRDLVLNARDAMAGAGTVVIRSAPRRAIPRSCVMPVGDAPAGRYVALSVSDHGVGMSPEAQACLFEPFFTTKPHNLGLGLAATYGVAKQHRGYIDVESRPGHGTTVTLFLPACAAPGPPDADPRDRP